MHAQRANVCVEGCRLSLPSPGAAFFLGSRGVGHRSAPDSLCAWGVTLIPAAFDGTRYRLASDAAPQ